MSVFKRPQFADDWSFLQHTSLPFNVDGMSTRHLTERRGKFLFLEVKRGEEISTGQDIALSALSSIAEFDVIVLNSRVAPPDQMNGRAIIPFFYRVYKDGELSDPVMTNEADFRQRYATWFKKPHISAFLVA
jgi:hypothetical protein